MKSVTAVAFLVLSAIASAQTQAQTTAQATVDLKATVLVAQALNAINGGTVVSDATATGTVSWNIAPKESGTFTVKMLGTKYGRIDLTLPSGTRSMIRNDSGSNGCGASIDELGNRHSSPPHQCWLASAWFSPLSWLNSANIAGAVVSYLGAETRDGVLTDHVHIYREFDKYPASVRSLFQDLTRFDLYLDSTSHLPIAIGFADHPDNNAGGNLPAEIKFSDYRKADAATLPFHIQRLSQGALLFDMTASTVSINTGVPESDFTLQ